MNDSIIAMGSTITESMNDSNITLLLYCPSLYYYLSLTLLWYCPSLYYYHSLTLLLYWPSLYYYHSLTVIVLPIAILLSFTDSVIVLPIAILLSFIDCYCTAHHYITIIHWLLWYCPSLYYYHSLTLLLYCPSLYYYHSLIVIVLPITILLSFIDCYGTVLRYITIIQNIAKDSTITINEW
jgi:hypothetical protein